MNPINLAANTWNEAVSFWGHAWDVLGVTLVSLAILLGQLLVLFVMVLIAWYAACFFLIAISWICSLTAVAINKIYRYTMVKIHTV